MKGQHHFFQVGNIFTSFHNINMKKKFKILHVDDSSAIILYIKIILMEVSSIKEIRSAGTVAQAKDILETDRFDVVILDINLPDGNGLMLLEWIKKHHPGIIVIMFTNNYDSFSGQQLKRQEQIISWISRWNLRSL